MPIVFVHGVPDTHRVWEKVRSDLQRDDVIAISLPGFGCPIPNNFTPTKEAYGDWLLAQLKQIAGPIDIVGHDWGGLIILRAMMLEPGIARSWTVGGAPLDAEYVWHDMAQMWQTPGVGEQVMKAMTPDTIEVALAEAGVPAGDAKIAAAHADDAMKTSILGLYRSAVHVGKEWESDLAKIKSPGLVLWGERDPYAVPKFGERLAQKTGAEFICFPNCSHWWQLERPLEVAHALTMFWKHAPS